ncbi:MAG: hypothetical protein IH927_06575 [Proteobacteria bacterium]|nr:hypothetical protein [Pseudomonadota bacterium]
MLQAVICGVVLCKRWRRKQALGRTWMRRPDLIEKLILSDEQQELLSEFVAEQKTRSANG